MLLLATALLSGGGVSGNADGVPHVDSSVAREYWRMAPGAGGAKLLPGGITEGSSQRFAERRATRRPAPLTGAFVLVGDFDGDGAADWLDLREDGEGLLALGRGAAASAGRAPLRSGPDWSAHAAGDAAPATSAASLAADRPVFDVMSEVAVFGDALPPFAARRTRAVACDVDGDGRDDVVLLDQLGRHRVALSTLTGGGGADAAFEVVSPVRGIDGIGFCAGPDGAAAVGAAVGEAACMTVRVGVAEKGERKCALFVTQPDGNHAVLRAGGRDGNGDVFFHAPWRPLALRDESRLRHVLTPSGRLPSVRLPRAGLVGYDALRTAVRVADFDGDGRDDVLLFGRDGAHKVALNRGGGAFEPVPNSDGAARGHWGEKGPGVRGLWGDYDGSDLAGAREGFRLSTFDDAGAAVPCGAGCALVAAGDFNGDGMADIAALQADGNHAVFLSRGVAPGVLSFERFQPVAGLGGVPSASGTNDGGFAPLRFRDASRDSRMASASASASAGVELDDDGGMDAPPSATGAASVLVGDFNGDGYDDLLVLDAAPNTTAVGPGFSGAGAARRGGYQLATSNGDGSFELHTLAAAQSHYRAPTSARVGGGGGGARARLVGPGDWDGSGTLDFAVLQTDGKHLYALNAGARVAVPPAFSHARFAQAGQRWGGADGHTRAEEWRGRSGGAANGLNVLPLPPDLPAAGGTGGNVGASEYPSSTQGTGR
jgi:hypothetical protein